MNAKSAKINICLKESYIVRGEEKFHTSVFIPLYLDQSLDILRSPSLAVFV